LPQRLSRLNRWQRSSGSSVPQRGSLHNRKGDFMEDQLTAFDQEELKAIKDVSSALNRIAGATNRVADALNRVANAISEGK
jgi:hypothetical protein